MAAESSRQNQTPAAALRCAVKTLKAAGCDTPELDAELLLAAAAGVERVGLHTHWREPLPEDVLAKFNALVLRRSKREPVAYILGRRAFYDVTLQVNENVLVPRPETEMLVELATQWCRGQGTRQLLAVDVGTGSGAIAIALVRQIVNLQVAAVDNSPAALSVARNNVIRNGLSERVRLVCADLLSALTGPFDLLVANLPYIPSARLHVLQPEVAEYEPRRALDGGKSGLDVIARLCDMLPGRFAARALVLLEIDDGQGEMVMNLLRATLPGAATRVVRDYAGLERVVAAEI